MDPANFGLGGGRMLIKLEEAEAGGHESAFRPVPAPAATLLTPKRGETVSRGGGAVKAFHNSAFTPTHGSPAPASTSLHTLTPATPRPRYADYATSVTTATTPQSEQLHASPSAFWAEHAALTPDTPGRKMAPERTVLSDRLSGSSPFCLTPERQPLDFMSPDRNRNQDSGRRGRPRADMVNNLIMEGTQSGNPIKCKICSRDFPREKSLQAHLRTHTGERPYTCDYPNCSRAFVQSGQLKTHQRLHAGEKPFKCPVAHCSNRYTHANRFCPDHPGVKPKRTTEIILQPVISAAEDQEAVYAWLEKYRRDREEKTPGKLGEAEEEAAATPRRQTEEAGAKLRTKRGLATEMEEAFGQENVPSPPRPHISRTDILRSTLTAHQSLNQALMRAAERDRERGGTAPVPASPAKSLRASLEESSPLRGVRRTLGEITPSKNCGRVDNAANLDLELGFPLELLPPDPRLPLPLTPLAAEKCVSPAKSSSSPPGPAAAGVGSPALKLKKRFQERFQEEKQQEDSDLQLARPISWHEEDAVSVSRSEAAPATPLRRERNNSPSTFLVAAALMELHESPTRLQAASGQNQDLPLNLTKK